MTLLARRLLPLVAAAVALAALTTGTAGANGPPLTTVTDDFESPLFGLAVAPGDVYVTLFSLVPGLAQVARLY